jgi:hypothetical protein
MMVLSQKEIKKRYTCANNRMMEGKSMVYMFVKHKVKDFSKWKPGFDEYGSTRKEAGSKGGILLRTSEDPDDVVVLLQWDNIENASKFSKSQNLKKKMEELGVIGKTDILLLDKIEDVQV